MASQLSRSAERTRLREFLRPTRHDCNMKLSSLLVIASPERLSPRPCIGFACCGICMMRKRLDRVLVAWKRNLLQDGGECCIRTSCGCVSICHIE